MESTTPIAARFASSAEPPAETNGSGTPNTGSTPSTTAMFTKACPTSQTRTSPAATA